ncbi:hypothetical protein AVEN_164577-1 [Araneus ventricosus]|uniref:Uncharacterized protein n=1 Tax=Araneus ventricosus TaxID=182803 RepID=A0A4Y2B2Z6_ARAVE|nr:hypothetical protein AVEN_164577-1 [Araneus ventricosus]
MFAHRLFGHPGVNHPKPLRKSLAITCQCGSLPRATCGSPPQFFPPSPCWSLFIYLPGHKSSDATAYFGVFVDIKRSFAYIFILSLSGWTQVTDLPSTRWRYNESSFSFFFACKEWKANKGTFY